MVMASGRWLGVHMDLLASLLIGSVALAAVLVSQDAGRYTIIYIVILSNSIQANDFVRYKKDLQEYSARARKQQTSN